MTLFEILAAYVGYATIFAAIVASAGACWAFGAALARRFLTSK